MRKFLIISCVSLLILSLFVVGASAESLVREDSLSDGVSVRSIPEDPSSYPYLYVFNPTLIFPSTNLDSHSDFYCGGVHYFGIYVNHNSNQLIYYTSSDFQNIIVVYQDGSFVDESYRILNLTDEFIQENLTDFMNTNQYNSISPDVGSALSFIGQVFTFISTNTVTLILIGLSVGLFFIVPFAIGKLKEFVKGY